MTGPLRISVVVGNPKPGSRTAAIGQAVAQAVAGRAGAAADIGVIELAGLAGELFAWGSPTVARAKQEVLDADLAVVASPIFKASFTGLLKAFLDQFGRDELDALPTVPVMVGAGDSHALAVETQLRPVLIEIGASMPTRGVFVPEAAIESVGILLDGFLDRWVGVLLGAIAGRHPG